MRGGEGKEERQRAWKKKREDERKRGGRREEERPRAMHTLPSRRDDAMGRTETAAVSGQERQKGRRKECICGLLDRVGGRVRRLGRAHVGGSPGRTHRPDNLKRSRTKERTNERTRATSGNSIYVYVCVCASTYTYYIEYTVKRGTYTPSGARAHGDTVGIRRSRAYVKYARTRLYTYANMYVCIYACISSTRVRANINIRGVWGKSMVGRVRVYRSIGDQKADPAKSSAASCALL